MLHDPLESKLRELNKYHKIVMSIFTTQDQSFKFSPDSRLLYTIIQEHHDKNVMLTWSLQTLLENIAYMQNS